MGSRQSIVVHIADLAGCGVDNANFSLFPVNVDKPESVPVGRHLIEDLIGNDKLPFAHLGPDAHPKWQLGVLTLAQRPYASVNEFLQESSRGVL
jgi:hypothetical protein